MFRALLLLSLCALALTALPACGGDPTTGAPPDWGGNSIQPGGSGPRQGSGGEIGSAIAQPGPHVLDVEDVRTMNFPVRIVETDGTVREIASPDELTALLRAEQEPRVGPELGPGVAARPAIEYVRLFYATDRAREAPGWGTVLAPLLPSVLAFLGALVLTRLLLRWLKDEVRRVAYVVGALVLIASGGFVARGVMLSLETLRLSQTTDVIYGSQRSASGGLELGTVIVSIPAQNHEIARIELPSLLKGEVFPDPTRHFAIHGVHPVAREGYFDALRQAVEASPGREACVFVHGYNNTFAYAAMRLAQIVYDVGFEGAPILYSWPSKGAVALYTHDKENADWSAGNLAGFLGDLREQSGAEHIHLLAHSMGSRVLSTAMMQAVPATPEGEEAIFSELILAAPDLDADTFERFIAPELLKRTRRVTLYASERDEALLASVQVNGQRRAGMAGDGIVLVAGMDTVDVTNVAGGHAYIADSGRVLTDLVEIVKHRRSADERSALTPRERDDERYWEMER